MTLPASTHVGRLHVESRHLPATQGGDGDRLLLYTDGVSDARDAAGRFFPLAQVTAEAMGRAGNLGDLGDPGSSRALLLDALVARLGDHVGDRRSDDILLLLVTMNLPAGHLIACLVSRPAARTAWH